MAGASLAVRRAQILAFRRRVGALDERLPRSARSLRRAAWAGLQDSMPRAALLSIYARVKGTEPSTWEHPSLAQLWGPRYSVFAVARRDVPVFSLGTMPDDAKGRQRAQQTAQRLVAVLGDGRMSYAEAGALMGRHPNSLRYAAATGAILLRWEGARAPTIWAVPPPQADPRDARLELARRYLHIYGPTTAESFGRWAGVSARGAAAAFAALAGELAPVRTPVGDGWILRADEPLLRGAAAPAAPARLLPSGDSYFLLQGTDRALLVPDGQRRAALWTPRVWPGAVMADGELVATWRRAEAVVTVTPWQRISAAQREAVSREAESLPVPGLRGRLRVRWQE